MYAPAKDEKQAKFFAVDASVKARATYNANPKFFNSASHVSKIATVKSVLQEMLVVKGMRYYTSIFETARKQKAKGLHTDVTVHKFMPNKHVKSSQVVAAMQELGFEVTYNPRSCNIKIVVK